MPKGILFSAIISILTSLLASCSSAPKQFISLQGGMLGTQYNITAELPRGSSAQVEREVTKLDKRLKSEMSIFDRSSQISRINRGESDLVTPWIEQNIRLADSISRLSDGVYDITCAPLVKAWGFAGGRPNYDAVPNIDSLLEFVGYNTIRIEGGRIIKQDPRTQIDLNSIAKGFAVDRLAEIVAQMGAENYIVDIGGEVVTRGVNPSGGAWRVGIESPIDGNMSDGEYLQQRVAIPPTSPLRAMATSGNYRRFHLSQSGEKIVHIIDPTTGQANSSTLLSVTVMARSCAEADAMATMLLAAGDKRAEGLAKRLEGDEGCEVYLISTGGESDKGEYRVYCSEGMKSFLMD